MRCMMTASLLATATQSFFIELRLAIRMPHDLSALHLRERTMWDKSASYILCRNILSLPLCFMVILGITSLIGVIDSHVIVLFDFIEERHEEGENLRANRRQHHAHPTRADHGRGNGAGVVSTGSPRRPLCEALCYAQIG